MNSRALHEAVQLSFLAVLVYPPLVELLTILVDKMSIGMVINDHKVLLMV